jgi:hypothetical protein
LPVGEAIVGGLGGHVRKVDPLPEHVASGGRLRRGNLQTLNIDKVQIHRHHISQYNNNHGASDGASKKSKLSILEISDFNSISIIPNMVL